MNSGILIKMRVRDGPKPLIWTHVRFIASHQFHIYFKSSVIRDTILLELEPLTVSVLILLLFCFPIRINDIIYWTEPFTIITTPSHPFGNSIVSIAKTECGNVNSEWGKKYTQCYRLNYPFWVPYFNGDWHFHSAKPHFKISCPYQPDTSGNKQKHNNFE